MDNIQKAINSWIEEAQFRDLVPRNESLQTLDLIEHRRYLERVLSQVPSNAVGVPEEEALQNGLYRVAGYYKSRTLRVNWLYLQIDKCYKQRNQEWQQTAWFPPHRAIRRPVPVDDAVWSSTNRCFRTRDDLKERLALLWNQILVERVWIEELKGELQKLPADFRMQAEKDLPWPSIDIPVPPDVRRMRNAAAVPKKRNRNSDTGSVRPSTQTSATGQTAPAQPAATSAE